MFEGSLVESRNLLRTNNRWAAAISLTLQISVAALLIAIPMLHPEVLPFHTLTPMLVAPPVSQPQPPPQRVQISTGAAAEKSYAPPMMAVPRRIPIGIQTGPGPETPGPIESMTMGGDPNGMLLTALGPDRPAVVRPVSSLSSVGPFTVSKGVASGMLLAPLRPAYPRIAIAAGIQGTVVIEAIISKNGTVESVRVISGPPLLQIAALDAVRAAHYAPYRLNGEPIEVQTTFSVNFKLND